MSGIIQFKTGLKNSWRTSLVAQWLRIRLPMQETWVRSLVWKIPHDAGQLSSCTTTTESACSRACASRQKKAAATRSLHAATSEYPAHTLMKTQSSQTKEEKELMESSEENKRHLSVEKQNLIYVIKLKSSN